MVNYLCGEIINAIKSRNHAYQNIGSVFLAIAFIIISGIFVKSKTFVVVQLIACAFIMEHHARVVIE
jgi:uncharacterized membrane protein HdeD (DUF308 family)